MPFALITGNGKGIPEEWIYPWPAPEALGFSLAADQRARVEEVREGSAAAEAGLKAGDDLVALEGQPLLSIADVSWVLHRAPAAGSLQATIQRDGAVRELEISLPEKWRFGSDISRRVATWGMRAMAFGGLLLEDLPDEERRQRGLSAEQLALLIKHVGQYGKHAAAKRAGFEKGDILVAVGETRERLTEGELIGRLIQGRAPGESMEAQVLRGDKTVNLKLPIQ